MTSEPLSASCELSCLTIASDEIYDVALRCRNFFEEYLKERRVYHVEISELQHQFLTWAASLGVFAQVSVCLDSRLVDNPELKALVVSILVVLRKNLDLGMGPGNYLDPSSVLMNSL